MKHAIVLILTLASCSAELSPELRADTYYRTATHASDPRWALECIDQAIGLHPCAEYYQYRASLNLSLKQHSAALNDFNSAVGLQKNDPTLYLNRGTLLVRAARLREAEADFSEALRLAPEYIDVLLHRAWVRRRQNRPADAERDVAEARRLGSAHADGFYNEGVRSLTLGDPAEAERMFRFALDLDPDHSRSHVAMARLYMERRLFTEAAAEFDLAISGQPRNAELYYHRGTVRQASGHGEEALADFSKAVELQPFEASYLAARGQAFHRVRRESEKAKADFSEAIRIDKNCFAAWYQSGVLHHELKELEAAEHDLRRAAAIRASPEGSLALGRVLHDQGDYDKALSLYRQALEIYKDADVQKAIRDESERTSRARENRK
jgi:tetratricopeptide (TPR) repeat protein